jgi:hypothetical protein
LAPVPRWLCFSDFLSCSDLFLAHKAAGPAATDLGTGKADTIASTGMRGKSTKPDPSGHRGWPLECMQSNCQRERGPSTRMWQPTFQYGATRDGFSRHAAEISNRSRPFCGRYAGRRAPTDAETGPSARAGMGATTVQPALGRTKNARLSNVAYQMFFFVSCPCFKTSPA